MCIIIIILNEKTPLNNIFIHGIFHKKHILIWWKQNQCLLKSKKSTTEICLLILTQNDLLLSLLC